MIFKEKLRNKIKELTKENEKLREEKAILSCNYNALNDDFKEQKQASMIMINRLREEIKDLKSNKNGLLKVIKHYENIVCKAMFDNETNLKITKEYRELIKLYNKIEGEERCYKRYIG